MNWLKQLLSDSNEASFSRVASGIGLLCSCGWISYIVWRTHALPGLEGLTVFISSFYGLGKAGETVQRVLVNKP